MFKKDPGKNPFKRNLLKELFDGMKEIEKVQVETKFNLASNIEKLLQNKGISKSEFASRLGKSPSEISKWMSGKHNFTIDTLLEVAYALKVDIKELLQFRPEPLFKTEVKVVRKPRPEKEDPESPESYDNYETLE
jgi:transcriptional regulator with XRE-family HTH domain